MPQSIKENDTMTMAIMTDLQHGGDAGTSSNQADLLLGVRLVGVLGDGALNRDFVAHLQVVQVRGQLAVGVLLDEEIREAS